MKLNYKRTFLVGLAFMSITAFWNTYNPVIPLVLKNTFELSEVWQGVVMAADNVLAVFLLPFFGSLSDKCKLKIGRRMPYIVVGTALATTLLMFLPLADYAKNLYAYIGILFLILLAMGLYRSPAVSLMSDVTPKPLRSKANSIINLMGALGGVFSLMLLKFLVGKYPDGRNNYEMVYAVVASFMLICVAILLLTINERKLSKEVYANEEAIADVNDKVNENLEGSKEAGGFKALSKEEQKSLLLILFSIFFWFVGYNAVETNFTKYANVKWDSDIGAAATCLMIATIGAVVSFVPVGIIATKFGRKRTIQVGIILLSSCFGLASFLGDFSYSYYLLFALVGVAWAAINVNSLPMVVEICKAKDIGKFTGYYYTFSMAAQIFTPIFCGFLISIFGYDILMPYGAITVAISFITITISKHGEAAKAK
ncbi:MAG: SLC45 family MFS transporter [Christensenellaceae bacterium]|nr:SLC45 family MFS transporter [Christensenellaceae bacterium]